MAFFANAVNSPINLTGPLHDLPKNPEKFCPRFIFGETRTAEDHVKVFKEVCNRKQIANEDVVLRLFPNSLGEVAYNWYVNLPPGCIGNWDTFERLFLEQFKTFINPAVIHQQFISIKRDPTETISRFNHRFHMAYRRLESPYTLPVEAAVQVYLNAMDPLTAIFIRRLPAADIDTLEKVFTEAITFTRQANPNGGGMMPPTQAVATIPTYPIGAPPMPSQFIPVNPVPIQQVPAPQNPPLTYPGYDPPKAAFFEKKVTVPTEPDNSFISELDQVKRTMSQMNNELTRLRMSQGQNNNFQRNNAPPYNNNFGQGHNRNFNNNNAGNNNGGTNFNPPYRNNGFPR